jgi:hypothetical protein
MSSVSASILAAVVAVCCVGAACALAGTGLVAVPDLPGGFQPRGGLEAVNVQGRPLDAAQVVSLAGKPQ